MIPEAIGDPHVIKVCVECNSQIGQCVEAPFLNHDYIAIPRTLYLMGIKDKRVRVKSLNPMTGGWQTSTFDPSLGFAYPDRPQIIDLGKDELGRRRMYCTGPTKEASETAQRWAVDDLGAEPVEVVPRPFRGRHPQKSRVEPPVDDFCVRFAAKLTLAARAYEYGETLVAESTRFDALRAAVWSQKPDDHLMSSKTEFFADLSGTVLVNVLPSGPVIDSKVQVLNRVIVELAAPTGEAIATVHPPFAIRSTVQVSDDYKGSLVTLVHAIKSY